MGGAFRGRQFQRQCKMLRFGMKISKVSVSCVYRPNQENQVNKNRGMKIKKFDHRTVTIHKLDCQYQL